MQQLKPSEDVFAALRAMLEELWDQNLASGEEERRSLQTQLPAIERQIDQFLDHIGQADIPSAISAYEKRIRKLEEQKALVTEKIAHCSRSLRNFDETLQTSLAFLENPWNHWVSPRFEEKKRC